MGFVWIYDFVVTLVLCLCLFGFCAWVDSGLAFIWIALLDN